MIRWPQDLVDDIARRKAVLYIGSGISANSVGRDGVHPPTWDLFLRRAVTRLDGDSANIVRLLNEKDYLTACEIIVNRLTKREFESIIRECFVAPEFQHHDIHRVIFKLDSRLVLTPNVDKIYETFANSESRSTVLIKNYFDTDLASLLRTPNMLIVRVHGNVDYCDRMIFTRRQYTQARYTNASFYKLLESLASTHTFIFLGCGLNDPDSKLMLENYAHFYPDSHPHYMVSPNDEIDEDMVRVVKDNMNLQILTYSSNNFHEELYTSLIDLLPKVEERRNQIAANMIW